VQLGNPCQTARIPPACHRNAQLLHLFECSLCVLTYAVQGFRRDLPLASLPLLHRLDRQQRGHHVVQQDACRIVNLRECILHCIGSLTGKGGAEVEHKEAARVTRGGGSRRALLLTAASCRRATQKPPPYRGERCCIALPNVLVLGGVENKSRQRAGRQHGRLNAGLLQTLEEGSRTLQMRSRANALTSEGGRGLLAPRQPCWPHPVPASSARLHASAAALFKVGIAVSYFFA
jgi:hypothetical protein